jgi:argininosuccinate lyase
MSDALFELSESFSFDSALWPWDIVGSRAHVRGLERAGLVSAEESSTLLEGLDLVALEFETGRFVRSDSDEDVHMAIERRLTELIGVTGAKLHTARSRNDQVATTLRLYVRDALSEIARLTLALIRVLDGVAASHADAVLPGYTHLQRAQPVLLSHHFRAHAWALCRDVDRMGDALDRSSVSPLGAGALAGTSLSIDPVATAADLGFAAAFANSLDAVSDRDFVAESLFAMALLGVHLSRIGEELVLWTSAEFGFATLDDAFTTGSSMLPQKKNSDVAELARAKTGRLVGNLTSLLVTLKGLPLSYNRDLQEDKEPLLDSVRQTRMVLTALAGAIGSMTFNDRRAREAASDPYVVAIDLAEWLVGRGVPFRQAHEHVGQLVGESMRQQRPFEELVAQDEQLSAALFLFEPGEALRRRQSPGASGPLAAEAQQQRLHETIEELTTRVSR